jgi:ATP-dependent protease ClpP protease subunit
MKSNIIIGLIMGFVCAASADTFRHKETGEMFYGFRTQKRMGDKILVYNSDTKKNQTIDEGLYDIVLDGKGRRDSIVRVPIRQSEALLSEAVSKQIAQSIIEASNSGPQLIIVEIDSPGGHGEYMRTIATAIEQTTNCRVAAYISGGDYGGAYSAAAVIAMACDTIYIAPAASIGAVGPMRGAATNEQYASNLNLYSSDMLAAYAGYAMGLTKKSDLRLVARALVDKSVSVLEVIDTTSNSTTFVERESRQPTQTIVRTLAEGVPAGAYRLPTGEPTTQGPLPAEVIGRVLTLTAADAVRIGLANKVVASPKEIAEAENAANAQFISSPSIDSTIRRFAAARRSIGQSLSVIQRLEEYSSTLEEQILRVEEMLRTGTVTREVSRSSLPRIQRREQFVWPNDYSSYYGIAPTGTDSTVERTAQGVRNRRQSAQTERLISDQPNVSLEALRAEQVVVLRDLVAEYRRAINLARRWAGGLPPELPVQTLESNMNSASAQLDNLLRYPMQTYQQPTQQVPIQGRNRR